MTHIGVTGLHVTYTLLITSATYIQPLECLQTYLRIKTRPSHKQQAFDKHDYRAYLYAC